MTGILGYARVSTGDQDVAGQAMRLAEAGAIKVFSDGRSGRSMDRPGLLDLLAYARHGDTLAVVRLDRLGRSLAALLSTVTMLKERGIALLSLEERIDTSSAAGELVFHVFGAIAQFERRLIAKRTKDGIAAARAKGRKPGRQPLDTNRIAAALKLVAAGLSPTAAARQLGLGRSTVYREINRAGLQRIPYPKCLRSVASWRCPHDSRRYALRVVQFWSSVPGRCQHIRYPSVQQTTELDPPVALVCHHWPKSAGRRMPV